MLVIKAFVEELPYQGTLPQAAQRGFHFSTEFYEAVAQADAVYSVLSQTIRIHDLSVGVWEADLDDIAVSDVSPLNSYYYRGRVRS